ncbi:MAG: RNA polymerase subunit sigma-70 [Terriglobia bacterium]|nr:MAG: RNA polymerase subunit sigma-70 [Terriglobia bacterium]
MTASTKITAMLGDLHEGRPGAEAELLPYVYTQLRKIAARHFAHERPHHTLTPTDLLHETYLRFIKPGSGPWKDRQHFFALASRAMRQVLVDYARARLSKKRSVAFASVDLDQVLVCSPETSNLILDVDRALTQLSKLSRRQSRIVELRFFAGLSLHETAAVLHVGVTAVKTDWALAKAWLARELKRPS